MSILHCVIFRVRCVRSTNFTHKACLYDGDWLLKRPNYDSFEVSYASPLGKMLHPKIRHSRGFDAFVQYQ